MSTQTDTEVIRCCGPGTYYTDCAELTAYSEYLSSDAPEVVADSRRRLLEYWKNVQQSGRRPIPEDILAELNGQNA